ncbi:hypothetical protein [Rhodanobacter sp. MP7CTX1]|uniref:hypothetical protein n=1 Tax=Rhodanobacter sp. MP7CTX1 TaxID=2723084 RepID=UPI001618493E|nr:hypothetical protein [Rhodanobacter sp. MP7CTX1]MBB6187552.1 hypothetical protein [Rhodanobacter sp. MP7CTX1]
MTKLPTVAIGLMCSSIAAAMPLGNCDSLFKGREVSVTLQEYIISARSLSPHALSSTKSMLVTFGSAQLSRVTPLFPQLEPFGETQEWFGVARFSKAFGIYGVSKIEARMTIHSIGGMFVKVDLEDTRLTRGGQPRPRTGFLSEHFNGSCDNLAVSADAGNLAWRLNISPPTADP